MRLAKKKKDEEVKPFLAFIYAVTKGYKCLRRRKRRHSTTTLGFERRNPNPPQAPSTRSASPPALWGNRDAYAPPPCLIARIVSNLQQTKTRRSKAQGLNI